MHCICPANAGKKKYVQGSLLADPFHSQSSPVRRRLKYADKKIQFELTLLSVICMSVNFKIYIYTLLNFCTSSCVTSSVVKHSAESRCGDFSQSPQNARDTQPISSLELQWVCFSSGQECIDTSKVFFVYVCRPVYTSLSFRQSTPNRKCK